MSKLKEYRTAKGLTQQALAEFSGVNVRQIQRYEAGTSDIKNMTLANAKAIADALGVEIIDLIDEEGRTNDERERKERDE